MINKPWNISVVYGIIIFLLGFAVLFAGGNTSEIFYSTVILGSIFMIIGSILITIGWENNCKRPKGIKT
jgi:hypothetical protein